MRYTHQIDRCIEEVRRRLDEEGAAVVTAEEASSESHITAKLGGHRFTAQTGKFDSTDSVNSGEGDLMYDELRVYRCWQNGSLG